MTAHHNTGWVYCERRCGDCNSSALKDTGRVQTRLPPIEIFNCLVCGAEVRFPRTGPTISRTPHPQIAGVTTVEQIAPRVPYDVKYYT
jgi:hypothetical protein